MEINFQENGNLPSGIHLMEMAIFERVFGYNEHRKKLISGLKLGIESLSKCGCKVIFIDGSFVTTKEIPGDFDSCWDLTDIDIKKLKLEYPIFFDFDNGRENQKLTYYGEFFPAQINASPFDTYLDFFQKDRDGNPKGIVQINLK